MKDKKVIPAPCDIDPKHVGKARVMKDGTAALPRGWSRFQGKVWCDQCWHNHFRVRAIPLPGMLLTGQEGDDGDKELRKKKVDEFYTALRDASRLCAKALTWAVAQCYVADEPVRLPVEQKLGPAPTMPYLYPQITKLWPGIPAATASIIDQRAKKLYRAKRWDIFTGKASLPTFSEADVPIRGDAYSLDTVAGQVVASFRLGVERWSLALGNRRRFARGLAAMDKIVAGNAKQVEARLGIRSGRGRGRNGSERDSGGQKGGTHVEFTVVCWLPRTERAERERKGTLLVWTHPASFLRVAVDGRAENEKWSHEDHVRRWVAEHARRLARLSDDQKVERRMGDEPSAGSQRDRLVNRQRRRLDDFVATKSRQLADLADRLGVVEVVYDDTDTGWVRRFPWFRFWAELERKLSDNGVKLVKLEARKKSLAEAKETENWTNLLAQIDRIGKDRRDGSDNGNRAGESDAG